MKRKKDQQGVLYVYSLRGVTSMYVMTYGGQYRGGSSLSVKKSVTLMSGRGILIYLNKNNEVVEQIITVRKPFIIPENVPHLFYFEKKSYLFQVFQEVHKVKQHRLLLNIKNTRHN